MKLDAEINKLPQPLVLAFLFICILPFALTLLGVDFSTSGKVLSLESLNSSSSVNLADTLHLSLAGSFTHTILEWSAFCTAIFTAILAFVHFSIKRDITTPIIALALLFSGCMDAFHTLAADRLIESVSDTQNFIPFTWAICRIFNAMILIVGILFLSIKGVKEIKADILLITLISILFGVTAFIIIHISATSISLPQTQFPDNLITRPYDVVPLLLFMFAGLYIYPKFNKKNPSLFAHALVISAIPEVAVELHMAFGSTALFDSHFNIAHFLKIFAYLVPFTGLALDYIYTSRNEKNVMFDLINVQDELKIEKDKTDVDLERKTDELKRRIKELDCLYGISTLIMKPGINLSEIIEGTSKLIILSLQHPSIAACSIKINDYKYSSENYTKSNWVVSSEIKLNNGTGGKISVCYFKEPPPSNEYAFTASEQFMINEVADRIGRSLDRLQAQNQLKETYEELESTQLQLIQAEKLDSIGKLSAGVAHEVKNPLAVIQLGVNYLQKTLHDNVDIDGVIQDMENAIHRADSVIKELVDFSASRELKLKENDINATIDESLLLVKHELIKYNITIVDDKTSDLPLIKADRIKLQQVFINLFMNAIHAMGSKGTLSIITYKSKLKNELPKHQLSQTGNFKMTNDVIVVEIKDTGPGLSDEDEGKIFEPFYTTKKAGVGTGLGLTVTENIIRLHNAFIDIKNRKEGGAVVSIIFRVI